jgi:hypothetical protein
LGTVRVGETIPLLTNLRLVLFVKNLLAKFIISEYFTPRSRKMQEYDLRKLVCELCRQFFVAGWVTGTGGSISIRQGEQIFMTPSGVQKERIQPEDLFIVDKAGTILSTPEVVLGKTPKLSDCAPLFLHAYNQRNAGKYTLIFISCHL